MYFSTICLIKHLIFILIILLQFQYLYIIVYLNILFNETVMDNLHKILTIFNSFV